MVIVFKKSLLKYVILIVIIAVCALTVRGEQNTIKWVDFTVPCNVMLSAAKADITAHDSGSEADWIKTLAYLGTKYGGNFSRYKSKDMEEAVSFSKGECNLKDYMIKYYDYYYEAYDSILGQFLGEYYIENDDEMMEKKYGFKVFFPIADGYDFGHYDDFGAGRSFGYKRKHLGHDILGNVGTPIIAVETGTVEIMGWNNYGGWRIGIRSLDKKRYYYYAHLRKGNPYNKTIKEGTLVNAGDVIGYMGMTGYSSKENVNNINVPHLHIGMELIFDEAQKDGNNQIWIDMYEITRLLYYNRSAVMRYEKNGDYFRKYQFCEVTTGV